MSERILEQQKAIAQVLSNERKLRHLTLSRQDVDVLEAVNKSLSPLVEFTDALSGEKYVSVLWQPSPKPSGHRIPPISTSRRQRASIASTTAAEGEEDQVPFKRLFDVLPGEGTGSPSGAEYLQDPKPDTDSQVDSLI